MTRENIVKKVNEIIVDEFGVEPEIVNGETRFDEDLLADSLDCVELIMSLEEEFGISISDEKAAKCATVKDAYDLVEELL